MGLISRSINIIPLGNSCTPAKKKRIYSPNKMAYVEMKSSLCGLLQNQYIILKVSNASRAIRLDANENTFSSMDIDQLDIKWPGKPFTTRWHELPRIVWKDDYHVDIYVKTYVRFGSDEYNYMVDEENDKKTKLIETKPFKIIVHYELQDK